MSDTTMTRPQRCGDRVHRPRRRSRLKGRPEDQAAPQPKAAGWHPLEWGCEFAGTAFQLAAGFSVVALLESPLSPATSALPGWSRLVLIGMAFGVLAAVVALSPLGRRSGAHLNPAVTVGFWLRGHTPFRDVLGYVVAQVAGALLAAAVFSAAWGSWAGSVGTARTVPEPHLGLFGVAGIEAALTFGLLMTVFLMVSSPRTARWTPAVVTGALAALIWAGAPHTGASMNPARTFGPDVVASAFRAIWCYLAGPVAGAAVAAGALTVLTRRRTLTAKLFHDAEYPSVHATALPAKPYPHPRSRRQQAGAVSRPAPAGNFKRDGATAVTTQFVPCMGRGHRRQVAAVTRRALREFGAVPLLVIAAFGVLAVVSILGDQAYLPGLAAVRGALSHVIGRSASTTTLQAVATGLITVTSITFSVLLLAVQQTASSLSPVVFDQFIRRRTNQAFLGFFVGLALYAYVVMAAVQDKTPPIIGAFLAMVLTVVGMLCLLALVYTSINQMRPANVVRQIHDRVLRAREREAELVRRTQRKPDESLPVRAAYRSPRNGYVTGIDLPRLARAVQAVPSAQLQLNFTIGHYISFGDPLATLRRGEPGNAGAVADAVGAAVLIEPQRNLDHDATTGIDELGNIAWTSGSTSKQNPEVSREAMYCLRDIAARLLEDDPARYGSGPRAGLPIVYPDNDFDRICETFYSLLVAAHESQQHMQAARVLETYRSLLERAPDDVRNRLQADLDALAPVLREVPRTPILSDALRRLPPMRFGQPAGR